MAQTLYMNDGSMEVVLSDPVEVMHRILDERLGRDCADLFEELLQKAKEDAEAPRRYRAKSDDSDQWYEGYYVEYPETTYCFAEDGNPPVKHCLVFHQMTDWGLPNRLMIATIDPDTIELLEEGGKAYESKEM